jgi:hypothetical protein
MVKEKTKKGAIATEKIPKEYGDAINASKQKWDRKPADMKELFKAGLARRVGGFLSLWGTFKSVENKFNIDPWPIVEEMRYKSGLEHGKRLGRNYDKHGLKELYEAFVGQFIGVADFEFIEFNNRVCSFYMHSDPYIGAFKAAGIGDKEIRNMADLFWVFWQGVISGFNPQMEPFVPPRLIMKGDSYNMIRIEHANPPTDWGYHRRTGQGMGPRKPFPYST